MPNGTKNLAKRAGGISIRSLSITMGIVAVCLSVAALFAIRQLYQANEDYGNATEEYFTCQNAANDMTAASDYLTSEVRIYVATQEVEHIKHYYSEVNEARRRDHAVDVLKSHMGDTTAHTYLDQALSYSNELMTIEEYAMRLVLDATHEPIPSCAPVLQEVSLSEEDQALSDEEKLALADEMVFSDAYQRLDDLIDNSVALCKDDLLEFMGNHRAQESAVLDRSLRRLEICLFLIFLGFLATLVGFAVLVLQPIYNFVKHIEQSEPLDDTGPSELRYLSSTYNAMYEESRRRNEHLKRKSELDGLTGIYNRAVFDRLLEESADKSMALLLIDVDNFKYVNDSYGHVVGDRVLQKLARLLEHTFRASDFPCRVGGDEFAVIMMGVDESMTSVVTSKIASISQALLDTSDGLPRTTLSIGVAFGPTDENAGELDDLYHHADDALYKVKDAGRSGYRFWDNPASLAAEDEPEAVE